MNQAINLVGKLAMAFVFALSSTPGLNAMTPYSAAVWQPSFGHLGTPATPPGYQKIFSSSATSQVVAALNGGAQQCSGLGAEYQADCLANVFKDAAGQANRADYAPAQQALNSAARRIASVVSANVDPAAKPVRKGFRKIRAVKKASVAKVNAEVRKIIAETQTVILRSIGNSNNRKIHFTRIATAAGSTKRILRS